VISAYLCLACVRLFCFARKAVGAACTRHYSDAKSRRGDAIVCPHFVVIPGRASGASYDAQLRI
jgi:hypothetical protein